MIYPRSSLSLSGYTLKVIGYETNLDPTEIFSTYAEFNNVDRTGKALELQFTGYIQLSEVEVYGAPKEGVISLFLSSVDSSIMLHNLCLRSLSYFELVLKSSTISPKHSIHQMLTFLRKIWKLICLQTKNKINCFQSFRGGYDCFRFPLWLHWPGPRYGQNSCFPRPPANSFLKFRPWPEGPNSGPGCFSYLPGVIIFSCLNSQYKPINLSTFILINTALHIVIFFFFKANCLCHHPNKK